MSQAQQAFEAQQKEIEVLRDRWAPLLEDVSESRADLCARLLDNEARNINEDTVSGNIAAFTRTALPTVRKAWGEAIILPEVVNVQAIPQPTGLVFYLRQKLSQNRKRAGVDSAIELGRPQGLAAPQWNLWNSDPYYDSESIQYELSGAAVAVSTNINTVALSYTSVAAPAALPGTFTPVRISIVDKATNQVKTVITNKGGVWFIEINDLAGLTLSAQPSAALNGDGKLTLTAAPGWLTGYTTAADEELILTVDYSFDLEANPNIPEVEVSMDSEMLKAATRKYKTIWTPEAEQDFMAYHDIRLEDELTQIMVNLVAQNVNREGINDLLRVAGLRFRFDYATSGTGVIGGTSGNFKDRNIALIHAINDVAAQIHRFTNRGPATFLIMGPEILARIGSVNTWQAAGTPPPTDAAVFYAGRLEARFAVYCMTSFPRNKILVGRKGDSALEAAYIHAPYVPLIATQAILHPDDFTPRKALMSRYARHLVEDGQFYYASLTVENLFNGTGGTIFGGAIGG